jgi:integrase
MAAKRNGGGVIEYVHPDGDVTYRIQYRDARRKQVKETLGRKSEGWTRTKARDERKKRVGRVADGYVRPDAALFGDYAEIWFERRQVYKSYSPATVSSYRTTLNRLEAEFGQEKLRDLTTVRVNAFTTRLLETYGAGIVNRAITVLGMILASAVEDGLIDPAKKPTPTRPTLPDFNPRPLTAPEARAIEAELARHDNPQIRLVFLTVELLGIRRKELRGLRWRDLDVENTRLRIEESKTKTGERSMCVPGVLLEELSAYRGVVRYAGDNNHIFSSRTGNKFNVNNYYRAFHRAVDKLGLQGNIRPFHELRATFITEGAKDGVSPIVLMAQAGHRDFSTTKRYIDLAGVVFEDEGERLAQKRMGLRVIEGGRAEEAASVQEAVS